MLTTITDTENPFFVDKSHVLGKQDYLIFTYFEDDRIEKLWDYHTVQIGYPSESLDSEPIGLDKMNDYVSAIENSIHEFLGDSPIEPVKPVINDTIYLIKNGEYIGEISGIKLY